jgi:hypothetical protein
MGKGGKKAQKHMKTPIPELERKKEKRHRSMIHVSF